jgi:hypothetical protein
LFPAKIKNILIKYNKKFLLNFTLINTLILTSFFYYDIGIKGSHLIVAHFIALFLLFELNEANKKNLIIIIASIIGAVIGYLYWENNIYLFFPAIFFSGLILVSLLNIEIIRSYVRIASIYLIVLALLGWIALFYNLHYPDSGILFSFTRIGRPDNIIYLGYGSFFNGWVASGILRVSGIYDEPGTFSLIVCIICSIRYFLNFNLKVTILILLLSINTFSLAHFIYTIIFIVITAVNINNINLLIIFLKKRINIIIIIIIILMIYFSSIPFIFGEFIQARLTLTVDGSLSGDNRSFRLINALKAISVDPLILLFGSGPGCAFGRGDCPTLFSQVGENPLTLLVTYGIFLSWPFYLFIISVVLRANLSRSYFVLLLITLIILQRPLFFVYGFSTLIILMIRVYYDYKYNNCS